MAAVETDLANGVLTVTLADEANRNALSTALVGELVAALDEADADPDVRVVVLTNRGRVFCAGADLKDRGGSVGEFPGTFWEMPTVNSFESGLEVFKPTIAAVNGHCIGYGLTAVVACDFVIAADHATFSWPEVTIGIPTIVGAIRLPRKVAWADAMELLLTGEPIDAERAKEIGLAWKVVPGDQLMEEAMSYAIELANGAAAAIRWTKMSINRVIWQNLNLVLEMSLAAEGLSFHTKDHVEAANAFMEKRPPKFTGQ